MPKKHLAVVSMGACKRKLTLSSDAFSVDYGVCTHIGRRQHNQDAVLVTSATLNLSGKGRLFAVADGMGGHPGGEFASRLVCDGLNRYHEKMTKEKAKWSPVDISRHFAEAIIRIDRTIRLQGLRDKKLEDMGTTLSCFIIAGKRSIIAHVGDSRIYRLRKGRLSCLTVDHTFVQDMIFEGEVDPAQAHLHPLRHMLTRAVGTGEPLDLVDTRIDMLKSKDCYLLCTDGLYNAITQKCILDLLTKQYSAADTATELITNAFQSGARDNVTAVVVKLQRYGKTNQNAE